MEFNEKDFKRFLILLLFISLAILVFLTIKPVFLPLVGGLLLAYIFMPVYRLVNRYVKERNTAAAIVSLLSIVIVVLPLWFIIPIIIDQIFEIFRFSQTVDVQSFVQTLFPTASESFINQITITTNSVIGKVSSSVINGLIDFLLNVPLLFISFFIIAFVFFFTIRDSDKFGAFMSAISPINKNKERLLIDQFKGVTDSIIYGQIIVGVVQGLFAGLGLFIFGIPKALTLTILAVFLSILPFAGAFLVWVPVAIYLFASSPLAVATTFLIYNLLIVSTIDNVLRTYLVARKTDLSPAVVVVGMIGGIYVFGILGLVLGPLILAYLITFLRAYKEKSLYTLFLE